MKQYEITILTREDLKEKPVAKEIADLSGKIISSSTLGQKQLAYSIKKEKEAFYSTILFEIEPEKILELNRKLGLKEEILRHLIIIAKAVKETPEKDIRKPAEKPAEVGPRPISPELKKPKEEEKILPEIKDIPKPTRTPVVKPVIKKEKITEPALDEEERLKALDKKLDELLKE